MVCSNHTGQVNLDYQTGTEKNKLRSMMRKHLCGPLICAVLFIPGVASAQSECLYETRGTTSPNTSGTPVVINPLTGTLVSANFFDSGAIDPPYRDGLEFVSVCVEAPDQNGNTRAIITTDVGLDDDTRIKAYPQFAVGTKFGNQFETSFRFYSNAGLAAEHQWPVTAANLSDVNSNFELANLEYISKTRGVGLPAFSNNLPTITVTLDIDEQNVVGAERDVMLESWFYDTSANADLLGTNLATGLPVVNTLNNIVGVGHPHFAELDNTLLEMMVHIGPLSRNDVSLATRNPGQSQLTEVFSGKDSDGDGIDDHFDVDSHVNAGTDLYPQPGIYSSGVDENGDGIDDADILPIQIGSFLYSIWYGESFLSPIVIYSRETNSSRQNDFDPSTPDMNLSTEGEITLPWNDFLNYTMNNLQPQLQALNVDWASGPNNLFSRISLPTGAIGGIEFGVEPQINGFSDLPYSAIINKFDVQIDGKGFGLSGTQLPDTTAPTASVSLPVNLSSIFPATTDIVGISQDSESGADRVIARLQRLDTTPGQFWNGSVWTTTPANVETAVSLDGTSWVLPGVDLNNVGTYRIRVRAIDFAGNIADFNDNQRTDFIVIGADIMAPTVATTSHTDNTTVTRATTDVFGTSSDSVSGVEQVLVRLQRLDTTPGQFWNGAVWTTTPFNVQSDVSADGTSWNLPDVNLNNDGSYRIRVRAIDFAGNVADFNDNPRTDFIVFGADVTAPTVATTSHTNNATVTPTTTEVFGTSFDSESGIERVFVRLQRLDTTPGQFWNGSVWTTTPANVEATVSADGSSWNLPDVNLNNDGSYRIRVRAIDFAGNIADFNDNPRTDFIVIGADVTAPTVATTSHTNNSTNSPATTDVFGTASDSESGVERVLVRLQRLDTIPGQFWNGSVWTTSPANVEATVSADGSSWNLPDVNLNNIGSYRIRVRAIDFAGNIADFNDNQRTDFIVVGADVTTPTVATTSHTDNTTVTPATTDVFGTSSDSESGVERVLVRLQRFDTTPGQFWNGSVWTTTPFNVESDVSADGTSWNLPDVNLNNNGSYRIRVRAIDFAGNIADFNDNPRTDFVVTGADDIAPIVTGTAE